MAPFTTFFGDYMHGLWVTWEQATVLGSVGFKANFQANYRARMYKWGNSAATVPDTIEAGRDYDYTGTAGGAAWGTVKTYSYYVAWTNPAAATSSVGKDGIYLLSDCTLTAGASAATDQPSLDC